MKLISFYSFKGGAGRTVCTANLVPLLGRLLGASKKTPMLVIDMDLDSAGLTHILEMHSKFDQSEWVSTNLIIKGGAEIYLSNKKYERIFFNRDYYAPSEPSNRRELIGNIKDILTNWGVPANVIGLLDDLNFRKSILEGFHNLITSENAEVHRKRIINELSFVESETKLLKKLDDFLPAYGMVDISDKFGEFEDGSIRFVGLKQGTSDKILSGDAQSKLAELRWKCENENFCAIVIDSASGSQAIANAIHRIDDSTIVYCMRLTKQFRDGTRLRLLDFIKKGKNESNSIGHSNIVLLPVAVPSIEYAETSNLSKLKSFAYQDIKRISEIVNKEAADKNSNVRVHDDFVMSGIPEVESFKWNEDILTRVSKRTSDQEEALKQYTAVANKIKNITQ